MPGSVAPRRQELRRGCTALVAALAVVACSGAPTAGVGADGANAIVLAIVDGDTIDAEVGGSEVRVRLLGIDTPEIAHPARGDTPATGSECFADDAHAYLRGLLPIGAAVRIERDIVGRDHYDRVLGYVHRHDGVFVNYEIVRHGFGRPLSIAPNAAHADLIVRAAQLAERDDVGLWSACRG